MGAIFERAKIAGQLVANFEGMRLDMRRNAQAYKEMLALGRPVTEVAAISDGNASEYLRRLDWVKAIAADPTKRAALEDGIRRAFGHSETDQAVIDEITSDYNFLRNVAEGERDASKNNASQINSMADQILAAVPEPLRLW